MATKTVVRYRNRPRRKIRRRAKTTIPVLLAAPVAIPLVRTATQFIGNPTMAVNNMVADFTGYNQYQGNFDPKRLRKTYTPIIIGYIAHKAANIMGINRLLARAKIPYIRL